MAIKLCKIWMIAALYLLLQ